MASSNIIFKYPPRLYDEGKSILQHHSMNHNCYLSKIGLIREGLGVDVWDKLKESSLGVFIKLVEAEYTWAAKKVHFILTNQLRVNNLHEIWSLIDGRPIRFSLNEFAHITGLNCGVIEPSDICQADHSELWEAMKVGTSNGPLFTELHKVMDFSKAWVFEKRMMVARLCLLSVAVHGIHHGSRIPLSSARRVLDPVGFEKYLWGRVAFDSLVTSVKLVKYDQDSYVIHGCVHALLIWLYESVPGIGEDYGMRRPTLTGVPLFDWQSTRKGIKLQEFLIKEKTKHGQMRVRHMIPVSEDNMYPKWGDADADANKDPLLDNLIKDIINNQLPLNAWDGVGSVAVANKNVANKNVAKKKRKLEIEAEVESSIKCQKNKMKVADHIAEEYEKIPKKKQKTSKEYVEDDAAEKKSIFDIWKMLETMNGTISELDKNMRNIMDALESKFESLVTKRVSDVDVKEMKESKPEFATSNNNEDDEATSKSPSWVVEENPTSHDGLPIQRVVKKVYTVKKKKKKEGEISGDLILFEKKDGTKPERKNYENAALKLEATKTVVKGSSKPALAVAVTKAAKKGGSKAAVKEVAAKNLGFKASKIGGAKAAVKDEAAKKDGSKAANKSATMAGNKMKMKSIIQEDDVVDVTDQVQDDALKMVSSSEDTFSDPGQQHANKVMNATLIAMVEKIKNLDEGMTVGRRVPQLAGSQKYPYVGNSTVKRIITDGEPSSLILDHLKPASDEKVHQLFDFLEEDEEDDLIQTSNPDTRFYWQILTLREQWPHEKYGWLKDYHMGAAMAMFRKRLMREPSAYPNQRITFLDQYMLRELAKDYKHFSGGRKCFKFRDFFAEHLNGTAPIKSATHKKWFVDVDHLYACLFVNGDHWVSLDIDLPMKRINIYDSIPHLTTKPEMSRQCMFLREMIPAMMSVMVPEEIRKKSTARVEVKRITKKVPVNKDPDDCAIYTIKYIECLALGTSFDGLCDENMKAIRIKLAAELYDEVRETARPYELDMCREEITIPHLEDSE